METVQFAVIKSIKMNIVLCEARRAGEQWPSKDLLVKMEHKKAMHTVESGTCVLGRIWGYCPDV